MTRVELLTGRLIEREGHPMTIPDEVLDHLADRYIRSGIDPERYPFFTWATVEAEEMGFKF